MSIVCGAQVRIYNLETGVELTGLTIEEKCSITSMFISQDQRHLLLNLAQQRIHLHELGDPATNTPSPTAGTGPVQKYTGGQEQKGRFVVRSCLGGINQAFVLSGSEDCKVCASLANTLGLFTSHPEGRVVQLWVDL